MEKKKGTHSWTISDELWEEIEAYIPKDTKIRANLTRRCPGKDGQAYLPNKYWIVFSMLCGPGASGKLFCENMGAAAVSTGTFKNSKQQVSLKRHGYWVWRNTTS